MRAVVVYESMYGNTDLIAHAIGEGIAASAEVAVVPVEGADRDLISEADLVVVGGPTHAHGMSRENTRRAAVDAARKPTSVLELDPDAEGPGLRDWFDSLGTVTAEAAAFDTRFDMRAALTGRAGKGIDRRLRRHGFHIVARPESFFVTRESHLEPGQQARAREWGRQLASQVALESDLRKARPAQGHLTW